MLARRRPRTTQLAPHGALLLVLAGCPGSPGGDDPDAGPHPISKCTLAPVGDPNADIKLELTALDARSTSHVIQDGSAVDLITPPQGGRVIFLGVRATNLDPCNVFLSGAIRDPESKQVRVDNRTINLKATDDGFAGSVDGDISTFANIPACPNEWSSIDIFDQTYTVEITLKDKQGRTAKQSATVRPFCAEPDTLSECRCICKHGYTLGQSCQ